MKLVWKTDYDYMWQRDFGIEVLDLDDNDMLLGTLIANMGIWTECGIIYHLWVKTEYRGKHIGTKLLRRAERKLRELGFTRYKIMVEKGNMQAINFYKRRGYRMTEEVQIGYPVMQCELRRKRLK